MNLKISQYFNSVSVNLSVEREKLIEHEMDFFQP